MILEKNEISQNIEKTSAIASWSGFVYQGKVALYHIIKMLSENTLNADDYLKLEHLDDFAIFNNNHQAISVHQVKATQKNYRSAYEKALSDAVDVYSDHCNEDTQRYFHVSVNLDDFSAYCDKGTEVIFYQYHNKNQYLALDEIDSFIKEMIVKYVDSQEKLHNSTELVDYKFSKLNTLIDSKVNFIHAANQSTSASQYQAADENPVSIAEIIACLESEIVDFGDESYILEIFRAKFISIMDGFIDCSTLSDEDFIEIAKCRRHISGFDNETLKKLFFSIDPDLSPKNKTMTLLRFPLNLLIRRSHYEKALHRRTNH